MLLKSQLVCVGKEESHGELTNCQTSNCQYSRYSAGNTGEEKILQNMSCIVYFIGNFHIVFLSFKFAPNVVNWPLSQISQDKKVEISKDKEIPITASLLPQVRCLDKGTDRQKTFRSKIRFFSLFLQN